MAQPPHTELHALTSNDYHQLPRARPKRLPATGKQLSYARDIAARTATELPEDLHQDRQALSAWIDAHRPRPSDAARTSRFANYPSAKQVGFAERIARLKRSPVPPECFHDRKMMSRWIDRNK